MRYNALQILKEGVFGNKGWKPHWRDAEPKAEYDVIIIGGGGHGLATAYYLAKNFRTTRVAVIEKGYIGGGNVGRNTTIVRANYFLDGNSQFYSRSLKLWENLEHELNYNVMMSQRGVLNLCHSDTQFDFYARCGNAIMAQGDEAVLMDSGMVYDLIPDLNFSDPRFPITGGLWQKTAGTARHDAVAWGYARAANALGVDIIQNCEVTGFDIKQGKIRAVDTLKGKIKAKKVGMAVAGRTSQLAQMAGLNLPIESHVLQAFVTEGLKPFLDIVVNFGMAHFYVSQSDKGGLVFGGDLDSYNSYAQRGNLPMVEHCVEAGMAMFPAIGRARILRSWGGIVDMTMDGSPIIDKTQVEGLFLNGGWCYGGFKATPASGEAFAHLIAKNQSIDYAAKFRLDRFKSGALLDEEGTGARPNRH